uniref:Putative secreted protein n=1 Tax=Xenopsylla cheopis TaxID=163159 RepID=A0A6M2DY95_XENCH
MRLSAHCIFPCITSGLLPLTRRATSSAYPTTYTPSLVNFTRRSLMTMIHMSGDDTAPCGHPLLTRALMLWLISVVTVLFRSI